MVDFGPVVERRRKALGESWKKCRDGPVQVGLEPPDASVAQDQPDEDARPDGTVVDQRVEPASESVVVWIHHNLDILLLHVLE